MPNNKSTNTGFGSEQAGVLIIIVIVLGLLSYHTMKITAEAQQDRTFEGRVIALQVIPVKDLSCNQEGALSESSVVRLSFEQPVSVWSEREDGDGQVSATTAIDLKEGLEGGEHPSEEALKQVIGEKRIFHYALSAYFKREDGCVPLVSRFHAE
jgi:hypothetical protein